MGTNKKRNTTKRTATTAVKIEDDESMKVELTEIKKKIKHKKISSTPLTSNTLSKKTKASMKKALQKIFSKSKKNQESKSRHTSEQLEIRRLYILSTIAKGNKTFNDDIRSLWPTENIGSSTQKGIKNINNSQFSESTTPMIASVDSGIRKKSILRTNSSVFSSKSKVMIVENEQTENRRVSFSNTSAEVIVMPEVNRAPPAKDNMIFDSNKSWITRLMNLKPKKPAIKILIDKKDTSSKRKRITDPFMEDENQNQNENLNSSMTQSHINSNLNKTRFHHFHKVLNIHESTTIDYSQNRVMYEEGPNLYFVNTKFSYTA